MLILLESQVKHNWAWSPHGWVIYVLGFMQTLRFLWVQILCRLYKGPSDETINRGPMCVFACKKIIYTSSRSCGPCQSSVVYGNPIITPHVLLFLFVSSLRLQSLFLLVPRHVLQSMWSAVRWLDSREQHHVKVIDNDKSMVHLCGASSCLFSQVLLKALFVWYWQLLSLTSSGESFICVVLTIV